MPETRPHVPIWRKVPAVAANGSTTRLAVTSTEVRIVRVLADINRILRRQAHAGSGRTLHVPCQQKHGFNHFAREDGPVRAAALSRALRVSWPSENRDSFAHAPRRRSCRAPAPRYCALLL